MEIQVVGFRMRIVSIFTIIFMLIFTACSEKKSLKLETIEVSEAKVKKIEIDKVEGFFEDDLDLAFEVFKKDCKKSKRFDLFKNVCEKSNSYNNPSEFFMKNFTAYELYNKDGTNDGLITGYYEPMLNGSLEKTNIYKYPIYKTPEDMFVIDLSNSYPELKDYRLRGKLVNGKIISYDSRDRLNERDDLKAICYVDDELDLFFLQIQGSGKVRLENGEIINIGYANQNGHKYKSVGKFMIEEGFIGSKTNYAASMQGMKAWLRDNPSKIDDVLNQNPSYVFFKKKNQGATGALNTQLVAGRNLAVDKKYIPLGMPVFINTKNSVTNEKMNRLMVAADVGGAIKGEIRADFFFGHGENAEINAGGMKEKGKLTILVPNN